MNEVSYAVNEKIAKMIKPTKKSQLKCLVILFFMFVIYIVGNYTPSVFKNNSILMVYFRPFMWQIVILTIFCFSKVKPAGKIRFSDSLKWYTSLCSIMYIVIMMITGIIGGFAKSPYDHSIYGIISNIITTFSILVGSEMARSYIINSHEGKNYYFIIGVMAMIMTFMELPAASFCNISSKLQFITFFGEFFLTTLCNNIFASYLVRMGGASLSIIYIGIKKCFTLLFPVIPSPGWNIKVLIEILYPVFCLMLIEYIYSNYENRNKKSRTKDENPLGWIVVTILSILIIWFSIGVFPLRPMVIITGSMEPLIHPGDVVIVKSIDIKQLNVGDIVQYSDENIYIFHRIIEIVNDKDEIKYRTKGDNNSAVDSKLVKGESIRGKVVYTIPKIGWPTLFLKSRNDIDRSKVEF